MDYVQRNKKIQNDTIKYLETHNFDKIKVIKKDYIELDTKENKIYEPKIKFVKYKSLDYLEKHDSEWTVLVFGSPIYKGGNWQMGLNTQEETFSRQSNILYAYNQVNYPLDDLDTLLFKNLDLIKDSNGKMFKKPIKYNAIVSCAVINPEPKKVNGIYLLKDTEYELTYKKLKNVFKMAIQNKCKNLLLGAYGCGAFHNPPVSIAEIFNKLITIYGKYFKRIYFAIPDHHNLTVFNKIIKID